MVFTGVVGAPANSFPNPVYTTIDRSPVTREKPYLFVDGAGAYQVFVPSLRSNTSGPTWFNGSTPGTSIPLTKFYIVKPGATAAQINQQLAAGKHLLFTPGIYHLGETIAVKKANTVVLHGVPAPTATPPTRWATRSTRTRHGGSAAAASSM